MHKAHNSPGMGCTHKNVFFFLLMFLCTTWTGCEFCVVMPCTVLVVDAGIRGALALRLILRGLWVDDGRVPLLEHLLHQGVCARVILAV